MALDDVTSFFFFFCLFVCFLFVFFALKTYEIHVNACITVKIVGGLSLCNGGKLEESEGSNCFFSSYFVC